MLLQPRLRLRATQVAYLYLKDGPRLQECMSWLLDEQRVVVWRSDTPQLAQKSSSQVVTPQQGGRRRRGAGHQQQ